MPSATAPTPRSSPRARWHRTGTALLAALVVGATGLVGYDAWLLLFAGDALERLTGLHLDAQLQLQVRLTPAAPHARLRGTPACALRVDCDLSLH